jgi:DNA-binding IclR family transcriptional regulator
MSKKSDTPLSRYARILEAVAAAQEGLNLSAIAEATGLQVGTSHRLVNSLCDVGFLARHNGQKVYVLGRRMVQLCLTSVTPASIVTLARPILRDLVNTHAETAYLTKLSVNTVGSVAMETPQAGEKSYVQPGRVMPFHASASAKAIFAFQPPEVIDRLLAEPRTRFTPDTKIDDAEIRAELARVRVEGFAVCDNELDPGVLGFAAPVRLDHLGVMFAIGVVGLSARLRLKPREEIKESLQQASRLLSGKLQRSLPLESPAPDRSAQD